MTAAAVDILREFRECLVREDNKDLGSRCESDLVTFCREITTWSMMDFHRAWWEFLKKEPRSLLLAPRDHAKTQHFTINRSAWEIIGNRDLRVLIVSNTDKMASRFMRDVKSQLTSEKVKAVWGDLVGEKWDANEIILPGRSYPQKEASLTALSVGGPVTSGHYDLVILDDVCDFENTRTQEQRDKLWNWYRFTLLPAVAPNGRLCVIGTRYHFDDLYGRLLDPMHNPRGVPSLIGKAIGDNGAALWPGRYPLAHLQNLRADLGSVIFNAQYQNDAAAMKGSIFRAEWMKRYKEVPVGLRKWQYCDLAISQKQTADYFAEVTIAQDQTGAIFVLDAYHARLSFDEQFRRIKLHHDYHHRPVSPVIRVGIEANQYQAALAQQLRLRTRVPVKPVHQHKDKMTRALRLQALFENAKIFFPLAGTEELENELLTFPEGAHDDLVDALAGACDLAGAVRRRPKAMRMPRGL